MLCSATGYVRASVAALTRPECPIWGWPMVRGSVPDLALDDVVNLENLWLARELDSNIRQNRHQDFAVRLELLSGIPDFTDA